VSGATPEDRLRIELDEVRRAHTYSGRIRRKLDPESAVNCATMFLNMYSQSRDSMRTSTLCSSLTPQCQRTSDRSAGTAS
jgi:hypothetical protein